MIFSIYVVRGFPDHPASPIFDIEIADPLGMGRAAFDCAGVYEVADKAAHFARIQTPDGERGSYSDCALAVLDQWRLDARAILAGDYQDHDTGNSAPIIRLWPADDR